MMVALLKYPLWVGEEAIGAAKKESPLFVPSVPLLESMCEKIVSQTREALTYAQDWEHRSQLQLQRRKEIEEEEKREPLEYRRAAAERILRDYRARRLGATEEAAE